MTWGFPITALLSPSKLINDIYLLRRSYGEDKLWQRLAVATGGALQARSLRLHLAGRMLLFGADHAAGAACAVYVVSNVRTIVSITLPRK